MTERIIEQKREKPILFNGDMVRAILDGRKTQTRRCCKNLKHPDFGCDMSASELMLEPVHVIARVCPFGTVGDQLWVRETWQFYDWSEDGIPRIRFSSDNQTMWAERADDSAAEQWAILSRPDNYDIDSRARDRKWRPSIHMPRWASRIQLEITNLRVERLQDISEEDAKAEGVIRLDSDDFERPMERTKDGWKICPKCCGTGLHSALVNGGVVFDVDCRECDTHKKLFKHLWESTGGDWNANPWVWVIEFKRVMP